MNTLSLPNYNLDVTLLGGQTHLWDFIEGRYVGFDMSKILIMNLSNQSLNWQTYPQNNNFEYIHNYLRLDLNYDEVVTKALKDNYVKNAYNFLPNVRIIKHDFEETLLMFILTQHKNIKSIRKSIRELSKMFGDEVSIEGKKYNLFPKPEKLAEASIKELEKSGIGFRAKYLKAAAKRLVETDLSKKIGSMNENEARGNLLEFYGIGDKVADCILCFSLGFDNVTPLDVWSIRIFQKLYKLPGKFKYDDMRKWTQDYFEGYAAWAGHFLWEYYRSHSNELE